MRKQVDLSKQKTIKIKMYSEGWKQYEEQKSIFREKCEYSQHILTHILLLECLLEDETDFLERFFLKGEIQRYKNHFFETTKYLV